MNIENFIYSLNKFIKEERTKLGIKNNSYLVITKQIEKASSFTNAIKIFNINLFYVKGKKNSLIININDSFKSISEQNEIKSFNDLEEKLIIKILNFLTNKEIYSFLLNEEYDKIINYDRS